MGVAESQVEIGSDRMNMGLGSKKETVKNESSQTYAPGLEAVPGRFRTKC